MCCPESEDTHISTWLSRQSVIFISCTHVTIAGLRRPGRRAAGPRARPLMTFRRGRKSPLGSGRVPAGGTWKRRGASRRFLALPGASRRPRLPRLPRVASGCCCWSSVLTLFPQPFLPGKAPKPPARRALSQRRSGASGAKGCCYFGFSWLKIFQPALVKS